MFMPARPEGTPAANRKRSIELDQALFLSVAM